MTKIHQELEPELTAAERRALVAELDRRFSESGIRKRRRARRRRSLMWVTTLWAARALRRFADLSLSLLLMVLLWPLALLLWVVAKMCDGGLVRRPRLGRWATHFNQYQLLFPSSPFFSRISIIRHLPTLFNIFRGDMAFVGPRPVSPLEDLAERRTAWKRYDLRPGILSLWWLRKRANIAYTSEASLDLEYVETKTLWGDFGIVARSFPVAFFGSGLGNAPPELKFLGIRIDNLTMAEAATHILSLTSAEAPSQVCFVNADCFNISFVDKDYRATLSTARLVLADGIGVRVAGAVLNQNVRENVNGTDMLPYLCAAAETAGAGIYLLGGRPGVAEDAAGWIVERYPGLKICGCRHGYFTEAEEPGVIDEIRRSGAAILLAALGAPRQDKWIAAHKDEVGAKVAIGVGGLLDFYSGRIPRAPAWVRELGMEWLYRVWQEPRRMWRRYFLGNGMFLFRVARERLGALRSEQPEGADS